MQQNFRHTNGSNFWGTQVAWGWEDNANRLATRNVTGGTYGAWVYYLNSSNFNSYAPTLTGGGASGTWGINITGSAGSAGSVDFANLTNKGSGTGTYTTSGDYRAPIFYDSSNTGYYVDPAGGLSANFAGSVNAATYNLAGLLVNASGSASTGSSIAIQQVTAEGWTGIFVDYEPNAGWGLYHDNPNNYFCYTAETSTGSFRSFTVPSRSSGNRTAYEKFRVDQNNGDIVVGGVAYAYGSSRAPIFYDYNDTAYYGDFAATSNLFDLQITGASNKYLYINPGNGYEAMVRYNGGSGSGWYVGKRITASLLGTENFHFYSEAVGVTVAGIDTAGNSFASGSFRAPIFYDSNDTGYYIDPASTSDSALRMRGGALFGPNTTWGAYLAVGGNGNNNTAYASVAATNGNLHLDAAAGYGIYLNYYAGTVVNFGDGAAGSIAADILSNGAFRSPIFYDYNDTAYYVDPNSASRMYRINTVNGINFAGTFALVGSGANIDNSIGARFTENYGVLWNMGDSATWHHQVINGSMLCGFQASGTNWGSGKVVANSDMRAPIFYDYNNTGYYVDPASTSVLNNIQIVTLGVGTAASGTTGEIRATNNVTAFYSSDIKFKENVRDIPDAVETVEAIGGKLFDWKDEYIEEHGGEDGYFIQKEDFGVIAQDVLKVFPIAVRTRPDGSLAVDYEKLSALAFAAVAELSIRVKSLEART
jgi:hypothetical protein